jgi:hypothetical protein
MPQYTVNKYTIKEDKSVKRFTPDPANTGAMYLGHKINLDVYGKYFILVPTPDSPTMRRIEIDPNWARDLVMEDHNRVPIVISTSE